MAPRGRSFAATAALSSFRVISCTGKRRKDSISRTAGRVWLRESPPAHKTPEESAPIKPSRHLRASTTPLEILLVVSSAGRVQQDIRINEANCGRAPDCESTGHRPETLEASPGLLSGAVCAVPNRTLQSPISSGSRGQKRFSSRIQNNTGSQFGFEPKRVLRPNWDTRL